MRDKKKLECKSDSGVTYNPLTMTYFQILRGVFTEQM